MIATETIRLPLSRGLFALIDPCDEATCAPYKWSATPERRGTCYAFTHIDGRYVRLHQFIMEPPPGMFVDHRDGNGLRNTRDNLRLASRSQNNFNTYKPRGSSRFKGVSFCKLTGRWKADISAFGKAFHLGRFDDETEAARAYDAKAIELHGEFARLNFPSAAVASLDSKPSKKRG